jgi:hypothetical protein
MQAWRMVGPLPPRGYYRNERPMLKDIGRFLFNTGDSRLPNRRRAKLAPTIERSFEDGYFVGKS